MGLLFVNEHQPDLHPRVREEHSGMPTEMGVLFDEEHIFHGSRR